jgi:5-formyltetrahydrofolate cyclo-ligase
MKNERLRQILKDKRKSLSEQEVNDKSLKICQKLDSFEMIKNCENVMVYSPFNNEVNINSFTDFCIKKNKGVIFPRVVSGDLKVYWVDDLKKLDIGYSGILEPNVSLCAEFEIKNINLVIVPGIVFDESGNRLGMGKGYYDRFLNKLASINNITKNKKSLIVGICYDFQVVDKLDINSHDFPMDAVVTDSNIYFRKTTIEGGIK